MANLEVNNKLYHFRYIDVKYDNDVISPELEMYRWELYKNLSYTIQRILTDNNIHAQKHSLKKTMPNVMVRLIFSGFANKKSHLQDGLFNTCKKSLLHDLKYSFTYNNKLLPDKLYNTIRKKIDIDNKIKTIIKNIHEFGKKLSVKKTREQIQKKYNCKLVRSKNKVMIIANGKVKNTIPQKVYNKLKRRYAEYHKNRKKKYDVDMLIMCIMIRYGIISSRGNQMGIPIPVKNKYKKCGINFEGFASSLNHHYKYYCSMFYDIEKYFCSLGSYMNITYIRGIYMHNPPYEQKLLANMVSIMNKSLQNSKDKLCFFFGLPIWRSYTEYTTREVVHDSQFFKKEIILKDYEYPWYAFLDETYHKIPETGRYIMANYIINIKCIKDATLYWKTFKY